MDIYIKEKIIEIVSKYQGKTVYRTPLIGFTSANDPRFRKLRYEIVQGHMIPQDLLPDAQTVVSFFIPFESKMIQLQREDTFVNRAWAEAYVETNRLIEYIYGALYDDLVEKGIKVAYQIPTSEFDRKTMTSSWSEKHVAYLCGLGSFGRHQMLITIAGCAGRLGSLVINAALPDTSLALHKKNESVEEQEEYCLFKRGGYCDACINNCPSEALTNEGLDKRRCLKNLIKVAQHFRELGSCLVCGKCATGPCALSIPENQ